jgi:hypothetical protein
MNKTHQLMIVTLDLGKYRARTPRREGYRCEHCKQQFLPPTNGAKSWKDEIEAKVCKS